MRLPKGFKKRPITNENLELLKKAWELPDDEFATDAEAWKSIPEEEGWTRQATMGTVMDWMAGPP